MRLLYNILVNLAVLLFAPFYMIKLWRRGNWVQGFRQRFGRYNAKVKQSITNSHVMWIHAVSVGEVNIVIRLIDEIEKRLPNLKIVVSTTTTTGMAEIRRRLPGHIQKIYYPIDRRKWVQRSLRTMHPEVLILVEAEIWPNFLWRAQEMKVPTFLVNARISESSYRGYRRFSGIFRGLFKGVSRVCCPSQTDAERLYKLGCRKDAVHVVGNMKFDTAAPAHGKKLNVREMLDRIGVARDALILVAGSTHDGEEALLAEAFLKLKQRFPKLFLIIVPRHHERGREAGRAVKSRGVSLIYRRDLRSREQHAVDGVDCLLVNTTGELRFFYEIADVVFVGKSITSKGGQNPIEPAALGKAIVFGPNMQNFRAIVPEFLEAKAVRQVASAAELEPAIAELLADPRQRAEMGRRAQSVVEKNYGAIKRTVDVIAERMRQEEEIYVEDKSHMR